MNKPTKEHITRDKPETAIDKSVEDTFPASDPPSTGTGGTTKIVPDDEAPPNEDKQQDND